VFISLQPSELKLSKESSNGASWNSVVRAGVDVACDDGSVEVAVEVAAASVCEVLVAVAVSCVLVATSGVLVAVSGVLVASSSAATAACSSCAGGGGTCNAPPVLGEDCGGGGGSGGGGVISGKGVGFGIGSIEVSSTSGVADAGDSSRGVCGASDSSPATMPGSSIF